MGDLTIPGDSDLVLPKCEFSSNYLFIQSGVSFDEWEAIGSHIKTIEGAVMWWIGDWLNYGESKYGETYAQALAETEYDDGTLRNAKWVSSKWKTSLRNDNVSFHKHRLALGSDSPVDVVDWADRTNATEKEIRAHIRDSKIPEISPAPPQGKYRVIVIDPPWEMEKIEREVAPNQVGFDYPTMGEEKLAEFHVSDFSHDDCHLFCWTTHKHLPMSLRLLDTWGFKYVLTMVWHKPGGFQPFGLPQYNCEFAVYARRGSPKFRDTKAFPACFSAPRNGHSVKPDEFYDLLRRVTEGPRIDVFNRRQILGFDVWGNESQEMAI